MFLVVCKFNFLPSVGLDSKKARLLRGCFQVTEHTLVYSNHVEIILALLRKPDEMVKEDAVSSTWISRANTRSCGGTRKPLWGKLNKSVSCAPSVITACLVLSAFTLENATAS